MWRSPEGRRAGFGGTPPEAKSPVQPAPEGADFLL